MRKYILIPEYAPLYSMRKCFGPTQGPLTRPTPTPVDIIGELLHQSGKEQLTIFEVIPEGKGFSDPVQLTLTNYNLPYDEIVGKIPTPADAVAESIEQTEPVVVEPTIVESTVPTEHDETDASAEEVAVEASVEAQVPEAPEETPDNEVSEAPVVETATEIVPEESVPTEETDPADMTASVKLEEAAEIPQANQPVTPEGIDWSKLTRAERRRLRKEMTAQNPSAAADSAAVESQE